MDLYQAVLSELINIVVAYRGGKGDLRFNMCLGSDEGGDCDRHCLY